MDTSAPKPGDVILTESAEHELAAAPKLSNQPIQVSAEYLQELWRNAEAEGCGPAECLISITPDGQVAMMSDTSVAQINSIWWNPH